ncbi:MAG: hypothetical protein V5A37_05695 [Halobacteriales archaeon]
MADTADTAILTVADTADTDRLGFDGPIVENGALPYGDAGVPASVNAFPVGPIGRPMTPTTEHAHGIADGPIGGSR